MHTFTGKETVVRRTSSAAPGRLLVGRVAGAASVCAAATLLMAAGPPTARAAEATRVVSGFEEVGRFNFAVAVGWQHDQKQAAIKRESATPGPAPRLLNDVLYRQVRDVLNTRVEMGVRRDLGVHLDLPFVVRDDRNLRFDQDNGGCTEVTVASSTCVNQNNSTLLRDGILPGAGQGAYGVDATRGGGPFSAPSSTVFKGPRRSGLEYLGLGISWAVTNQARDVSRPTLVLALDGMFDVATTMRYDAAHPDANTGVGLGYHQVKASTAVSRRLGAFESYFGAYYTLPVRGGSSPFNQLPSGNQPHAAPQAFAGAQFGFEFVPWERPESQERVALEVRLRGDHHFQGSSHSELWEPLSGSSLCGPANPGACRPGIDLEAGGPHPGVTETQPYSTVGGDVAVNVRAGRLMKFRGVFGMSADLSHDITFATAGRDRNGDGQVDSTSAEANPAYRESIDLPGRRLKVEGSHIWNLALETAIVF